MSLSLGFASQPLARMKKEPLRELLGWRSRVEYILLLLFIFCIIIFFRFNVLGLCHTTAIPIEYRVVIFIFSFYNRKCHVSSLRNNFIFVQNNLIYFIFHFSDVFFSFTRPYIPFHMAPPARPTSQPP